MTDIFFHISNKMKSFLLMELLCIIFVSHNVSGQGNIRIRHVLSMIPSYQDGRDYNPTLCLLSTTEKYIINGRVSVPYQQRVYPFTIQPLGYHTLSVLYYDVGYNTGYQNTAITIEADGDVVVYSFGGYSSYYDSFYVIPFNQLGKEYYLYSYDPYYTNPGSHFSISALQENTDILIYFNKPYIYSSVTYDRYNPLAIKLNSYSTHLFEVTTDFTGTYLESTKPVSVVCGNPDASFEGRRSALMDIPAPVESWGSLFLVTYFKSQSNYLVRVLAAYNNTEISVETIGLNDTRIVTLQPGEYYHQEVPTGTMFISSSNPVMVVQYTWSKYPAMVMVPPLDRAIKGPLRFINLVSENNYLTVWISSLDVHGLLVDGVTITGTPIETDYYGWSIIHITVEGGENYVLSHVDPDVRMVAIAYRNSYSANAVMYFVQEGDSFPPGSTDVFYTFTDISDNNATCMFEVLVRDVTTPDIMHCPSDLVISTCTSFIEVSWEEPTAFDDSGQDVTRNMSHSPGDQFFIGDTTVNYIFTDLAGNEAICNFLVTIGPQKCTSPAVTGLIVAITIFSLAIILLIIAIVLLCVQQQLCGKCDNDCRDEQGNLVELRGLQNVLSIIDMTGKYDIIVQGPVDGD
ncbi:putative hyalin-like isoform X2 [Apostichopus japonicus]|uniref:Putative hyalin-like isoform X2 n=1 Tax=Stichopus japonicus TaxID=307972 RepID=A0A2G8KQU5_STIJA|nr:putative hyalin-like isoform X2 [Apostichopus japonicus]